MLRLPYKLPGNSLKAQLITLLFALTAIAIIVLSFLGIRAVTESGSRTSEITAEAMKKRVEQLLVQTTAATAEKNSIIFTNIQHETGNTAKYVQGLFDNPTNFPNRNWQFDQHVFKLPTGQYTNAASEASSVLLPPKFQFTTLNKRRYELTSYLDYFAPQLLKNETNAVAVYYMGSPQGETRYYPNIELAKLTPPDFEITQQEFFTAALPKNDPEKTTRWTSVYDDPAGNGLMITASTPIYTSDGTFSGAIGMDVTLNNIAKNIEDYSPIESSYAFLIDQAGRAVALPAQGYHDLLGRAPTDKEFGSDLKNVKGDFGGILQKMRAGKRGFTSAEANNTDLYVAYEPIVGTGFSLGIVARQAAMLKVVTALQGQVAASTQQVLYYQFVPVGVVILLVVWLFGFLYIRRITEPIKQLTTKTAQVASGNFNVRPEIVHDEGEIGQLATSFNSMVTDLRDSRQKIEEQNQELLHNEQARLKASINSLHVGFIMTDTLNNVIMLNGAAKRILSKNARRDWSTAEIDDRLGPAVAFKKSLAKVLRTGKPVEKKEIEFENEVLRVFMAPILEEGGSRGSQKIGAVVLIENITEAKMLERSKEEFFSIASHELRTPLTAIRGNAALLQRVFSPKVHEGDFDEMVGDIHDASVRLIEIVNDFLDATRLEQGKITFENQAFSVYEPLKAVAYEMEVVGKEKGIEINIEGAIAELPYIYADKDRVKQIIYNLVGNAMKFTEKGAITINARVIGANLTVFVHDTGPGISAENQRLLFRKFQQAGNSFLTRDTRGTGLGLYISKLLGEQMGGYITFESSKLGVGTTFSFTLPLAKHGQASR